MERKLTYTTMFEEGIYTITVFWNDKLFFEFDSMSDNEDVVEERIFNYLSDNGYDDDHFELIGLKK